MALSGTGQTNKAQVRRDAEQKIRRKLHRWFKSARSRFAVAPDA